MVTITLLGATFGWMIAGFPGLIIGAILGVWGGRAVKLTLASGQIGRVRTRFLEATFAVMGAMCKADGQVTSDEIDMAETMFDKLRLSGADREAAKAAFNRGKTPEFDLDAEVAAFATEARGQRPLLQMFLQVQLSAIAADGHIDPAEQEMLRRVARGLGLSEAELARLEAMLGGAGSGGVPSQASLEQAYEVLGVDPDASDAEVKKAYRRLMSQNHPDKLAAKGLPESMREMAEQKTREITNAYERISEARA
ncbi:co-chaperone DjlA [Salinisphaera sp. P385]|uniref:Co-chaperone DjlA n=1 Tax=Spectribacter acetivorans TaxID=3075603 RepID=A0ABU3B440_9GAMM|nr:co-chaperone DjlA [Salinisphaera sp. P385]MDT0617229.1 co-chaperone DjlA [Salinisphaera sp. P385]